MSQTQNNQVSPSQGATNTNPSDPPQVGGSGSAHRNGQPGFAPAGYNAPYPPERSQIQMRPTPITRNPNVDNRRYSRLLDQSEMENCCCCSCHLRIAVTVMLVLNLAYLVFKVILYLPKEVSKPAWWVLGFILYITTIPIGFGPWSPLAPELCFLWPVPLVARFGEYDNESEVLHKSFLAMAWLIWLLDVITTIMFMIVAFCEKGTIKSQILVCNVFMCYNYFYPGIILHLAIYIGTRPKKCRSNNTLFYWVFQLLLVFAWAVRTAQLAKAYRNAIERAASNLEEQGRVGGREMSTVGVNAEGTGGRQMAEVPV